MRFEMFNVFNHANFTSVVGNANSGQFGQATNTAPAVLVRSAASSFSKPTQTNLSGGCEQSHPFLFYAFYKR